MVYIFLQIMSFFLIMAGIGGNPLVSFFGFALFLLLDKAFKNKIYIESRDGKCSFCRGKSFGDNDYDCDTCNISYFIKDGDRIVTNGESYEYKFYGPF